MRMQKSEFKIRFSGFIHPLRSISLVFWLLRWACRVFIIVIVVCTFPHSHSTYLWIRFDCLHGRRSHFCVASACSEIPMRAISPSEPVWVRVSEDKLSRVWKRRKTEENIPRIKAFPHTAQTIAYRAFFRPVNRNKISQSWKMERRREGEKESGKHLKLKKRKKQKHTPRRVGQRQDDNDGGQTECAVLVMDLCFGTTAALVTIK